VYILLISEELKRQLLGDVPLGSTTPSFIMARNLSIVVLHILHTSWAEQNDSSSIMVPVKIMWVVIL